MGNCATMKSDEAGDGPIENSKHILSHLELSHDMQE